MTALRAFLPPALRAPFQFVQIPTNAAPAAPLGSLVFRPMLYRRNAVTWVSVRSWRADAKKRDLAAFKLCKAGIDPAVIAGAAGEVAQIARLVFGPLAGWLVTSIACGHARRPDCFGKRLGRAVADTLDAPFLEVFEERFVAGSSHPKEFDRLPPLLWRQRPDRPSLVIDDVATSGWHIEEALGMIRALGLPAFGLVWISGTVLR